MAASAATLATRHRPSPYFEPLRTLDRRKTCFARHTESPHPHRLAALRAWSITFDEAKLVFAVGLHPHAVRTCLIIRPHRPAFLARPSMWLDETVSVLAFPSVLNSIDSTSTFPAPSRHVIVPCPNASE